MLRKESVNLNKLLSAPDVIVVARQADEMLQRMIYELLASLTFEAVYCNVKLAIVAVHCCVLGGGIVLSALA